MSATLAQGQVLMQAGPNGHVNIFNTDLAVFEAGEVRKDLACTVTPAKPVLGFDLRFHAGYDVTIALKELAGSENSLNILFRVAPQNHPDHPVFFTQHIRVPKLDDEAKGDAFTIMTAEDSGHVFAIERFISQKIQRVKLENFDYRYTAIFDEDKSGKPGGFPGKARAVRVHGGYHFGPARRRR